MNPDLIRTILMRLYEVEEGSGYVRAGIDLSPPWLADFEPDEVATHLDRLIDCGYIVRTNKIKMTYHPDPATLEATSKSDKLKTALFDDQKWSDRSGELVSDLEDCAS